MANRYWVGGTASWDGTAGTKWAATSGAAGGASVPTSADDVFFDANSGANTVTIAAGNTGAKSINCTGFTGTLTGTSSISVAGSITLVAGMTWNYAGTILVTGTGTIISAGKTWTGSSINVNGAGITVTLGDAYTTTISLGVTQGTFNTGNFSVTASSLSSSVSSTRTINLGSSNVTLTGGSTVVDFTTTTNLTFNKGTANILLTSTSTSTRSFKGGGQSYNKLTIGGTTGISILNIEGANSFTELASTKTVAHTIRFLANQGTIDTWSITGSSGNVVTVDSSVAGTQRTFTLTNPSTNINYLSVKDIGELSGNKFYVGTSSTDGGNNTNVYFAGSPGEATGNMFMLLW